MGYDFTSAETLAEIEKLLKKPSNELAETEADMLIEYKADCKAKQYESETFRANMNELQAKIAEYTKKLSDLAKEEAKAQYDKMAQKLAESE